MAATRAKPGAAAAVVSRVERPGLEPSAQRGTGEAALVATASAVPTSTLLVRGAALQVAPNMLSIAHRDRLLRGALYAPRALGVIEAEITGARKTLAVIFRRAENR